MKEEKTNFYGPNNNPFDTTQEYFEHNIPPFYYVDAIKNTNQPCGITELRRMITPQLKPTSEYDVVNSLSDLLKKNES